MAQPALDRKEKKLTGKHVLLWVCGFFGVMFIANGFFVYYARTTFPGVVENSPYQASQNYNKTLAEAAAQEARSWQMEMQFKRRGNDVFLVLSARDKLGNPLDDLAINANVGRPVTDTYDHQVLLQPNGEGVYQAQIGALDPGRWRISFEATQNNEVKFQSTDTVTLK